MTNYMKKQIWFIRHGQSITNAGGTWPDPDTIPLTEKGHEQAKAASQALVHEPTLVVTSPYSRTLQTARPTLERWPEVSHEEWPIHEFTYLCTSKLANASFDEFLKQDKIYWDRLDPHHQDGPEAESFVNFMKRVDTAIEGFKSITHEKAVVFSHALFLKALFYRFKNPHEDIEAITDFKSVFMDFRILNTAITHYSIHPDGEVELHSHSTDHLDDEHE